MSKGYPVEGVDHLSIKTIETINKIYAKPKHFYEVHLKGGDVKLATLYRALNLEYVSVNTVDIIENKVKTLRSRHKLDRAESCQALDQAVMLFRLFPKALEKKGKHLAYLKSSVRDFLKTYDKEIGRR